MIWKKLGDSVRPRESCSLPYAKPEDVQVLSKTNQHSQKLQTSLQSVDYGNINEILMILGALLPRCPVLGYIWPYFWEQKDWLELMENSISDGRTGVFSCSSLVCIIKISLLTWFGPNLGSSEMVQVFQMETLLSFFIYREGLVYEVKITLFFFCKCRTVKISVNRSWVHLFIFLCYFLQFYSEAATNHSDAVIKITW